MTAYDMEIRRCCANCVHLDQPECSIAGLKIGGCRSHLSKCGPPNLRCECCAQWYLVPLDEDDL